MKPNKSEKVEIKIKLLERIAEFYRFPMAVFFMQIKDFRPKTRQEVFNKKTKYFDKIKEIVEEYENDKT